MSGHNKWSKIKHTKGKADAARSASWTKLIREITVAVRQGGPDVDSNFRLRKAVDDAKAVSMPKDTMERAIKRGAGALGEGETLEELIYEGYGPGGVAVLVEVTTDNRHRTAGEIRSVFTRTGGTLAQSGAVAWQFARKAFFSFETDSGATEDKVMEVALEHGAEDVAEADGSIDVKAEPAAYEPLKMAFEKAGLKPATADITMIPQATVKISGQEASTMLKLMERLEENDDVQKVHANFDIDQAEMEALSRA
ncbi:MAG: YebC/PmpR family DNA-binding transcriptional regulator [Deltaproteobacteria bacterium]|nr:YebC/PmpR family DNA-binding transcriptional regulator [Deltaproteobacteria bacterium]